MKVRKCSLYRMTINLLRGNEHEINNSLTYLKEKEKKWGLGLRGHGVSRSTTTTTTTTATHTPRPASINHPENTSAALTIKVRWSLQSHSPSRWNNRSTSEGQRVAAEREKREEKERKGDEVMQYKITEYDYLTLSFFWVRKLITKVWHMIYIPLRK